MSTLHSPSAEGTEDEMSLGQHLLCELYAAPPTRLDDPKLIGESLERGAAACGLTPVAPPLVHRFEGGGITGVLLLAESHVAIHTFPEKGCAALDIYTCGDHDPRLAEEVIVAMLGGTTRRVRILDR